MNGNYAAGVLEGLVHFIPETVELVSDVWKKSNKSVNGKNKILSL
jgi:hypothetical protein